MTSSIIESVEQQWIERAKAQKLKYGTAKYKKAEVEFFMGAMAGFVGIARSYYSLTESWGNLTEKDKESRSMIPSWIFGSMRGEIISKEDFKTKQL